MTIYYLITQKCNLSCSHCIRGVSKQNEMNTAEAVNGLKRIHSDYKDAFIILSGGEPTLHRDFDTILTVAANLFKTVVINSNGTTNYFRQSDNWQKENIHIQFSIDGDEKTHNIIRGNNSFQKIIENIEYINSYNVPIWVSSTVSSINFESIMQLSHVLRKYDIEKWQVAPMMPFGKADKKITLRCAEWNRLVDELIKITPFRLGVRKIFDINALEKLTDFDIERISSSKRITDFRNCGCITSKVYIYPDMKVYPCTCLKDIILGNRNYSAPYPKKLIDLT